MKKVVSVFYALFASLFLISFAIALPITVRPFYYCQIESLGLTENYSQEEVKTAFDDVMDYLHHRGEFKTGALAFSDAGKSHFADCKKLFNIDYIVLIGSLFFLMLTRLYYGKNLRPLFWGGLGTLSVLGGLGVWGIVDFDSLFVAFHTVFFPGKDNWIFDPSADEIINILPEQFFANCALLILSVIIIGSVLMMILGRKKANANQ